jgi:hypothetical protein
MEPQIYIEKKIQNHEQNVNMTIYKDWKILEELAKPLWTFLALTKMSPKTQKYDNEL